MLNTLNRPSQKNVITNILALAKRNLDMALSSFAKKEVFRVRVANEKAYGDYFNKIVSQLNSLSLTITSLPNAIDKKTPPIVVQPTPVHVQELSKETIDIITKQLNTLKQTILSIKQVHPKVQEVKGRVTIENIPTQKEFPIEEIVQSLKHVEDAIRELKLQTTNTQKIKIPEFPSKLSFSEGKDILKAIQGLTDSIEELPDKIPQPRMPKTVEVSNFPIQKIPQPVTHMSINGLQGFAKSNAVTVTSSLTPLPSEILANRRSLVVYNNSDATTVFVGGSDVTATNGLPVKAGNYSPAFDASPSMVIYGITSSGSANVRVLELSDDKAGK